MHLVNELCKINVSALLTDEVKGQVVELVHKFASMGFLKYRELLSNH